MNKKRNQTNETNQTNQINQKALLKKVFGLKRILSNPIGILPDNYKFNREEAHER